MARKEPLEKVSGAEHLYRTKRGGVVVYYVKFKLNGKQLGEKNITKLYGAGTLLEAKKITLDLYSKILKGINPFLVVNDNTVDELFDRYISSKKPAYQSTHKPIYNKWIKPFIGSKSITTVERKDVESIAQKMKDAGHKGSYIIKVRTLLTPLFNDAVTVGLLQNSIIDQVQWKRDYDVSAGRDEPLTMRVKSNLTLVAKRLYQEIMKLPEESPWKFAFLVSLMCGRRRGEILKITYRDIDSKGWVTAKAEHTKTGVADRYPLPKEAWFRAAFPSAEQMGDTVVKGGPSGFNTAYNRLLTSAGIELHHGKKIGSHENRDLMLSILTADGKRDFGTIDRMLSHKHDTAAHYHAMPDSAKEVFYQEYWAILREEIKPSGKPELRITRTREEWEATGENPFEMVDTLE